MTNTLTAAQNAALNITLDSIERRTNRAWQHAEHKLAAARLSKMSFAMPEAAAIACKLAGEIINTGGKS